MLNPQRTARDIVTIGGSAGALGPLLELVGKIGPDPDITIAMVLHRSPVATSVLHKLFARRTDLPVVEPRDGRRVPLAPGQIYVAPPDEHMVFEPDGLHTNRGPRQHRFRPAIDPLFISAARFHGRRVVGVLLSGGGADGVAGLIAIKAAGGMSLVQDPEEAGTPIMPANAIRMDDVDAVLRLHELAVVLPRLAAGESIHLDGLGARTPHPTP